MSDKSTPGVSSPRGRKGKGKAKAKAIVPSISMELRSSTDDRQPLIAPESATEGQGEPPIPREESMDTEEVKSEVMEISQSSDSQMAIGPISSSKSSDPPSVAFPFDDMEDSPSLSKRAKKGDSSDLTDPRDQVISISSDGQIELDPIPGPSGLQPPVSPSTLIQILPDSNSDYRNEVARAVDEAAAEFARELAASPTITSAHSRATTFLSSVLGRVIKRQLPTPSPPQIEHWSDTVFTPAKYVAYLAFFAHSFGLQYTIWVKKDPYPSVDGVVGIMYFFEMLGMIFMLGGYIHGHNNWFIFALFCYIPLLLCYGPEVNIFTCWWTIASLVLIAALSVRIVTWEMCKPVDMVYDWRDYFRRVRAHEIIEQPTHPLGSQTERSSIEATTEFQRPEESRGESRVTITSGESRPSQVVSPIMDVSETPGSTPSAATSRNVSRLANPTRAGNVIETVAIIEPVPPQDESTDSGETSL